MLCLQKGNPNKQQQTCLFCVPTLLMLLIRWTGWRRKCARWISRCPPCTGTCRRRSVTPSWRSSGQEGEAKSSNTEQRRNSEIEWRGIRTPDSEEFEYRIQFRGIWTPDSEEFEYRIQLIGIWTPISEEIEHRYQRNPDADLKGFFYTEFRRIRTFRHRFQRNSDTEFHRIPCVSIIIFAEVLLDLVW